MNAKKLLCVLLVFTAVGTAVLIAQQSSAWTPEGEQCFSLAGVEYYHTYYNGARATMLKNHNNYGVTVLYTGTSGRQQSTWIDAGKTKRLEGHVTVDNCTRN